MNIGGYNLPSLQLATEELAASSKLRDVSIKLFEVLFSWHDYCVEKAAKSDIQNANYWQKMRDKVESSLKMVGWFFRDFKSFKILTIL